MSIVVDKLTKVYGTQTAVNGVSFEVKSGEVLGFLGPNGAGKTTVMKMLTCYMAPTSGDAIIDGMSIYEEAIDIKRKIGYLPEDNPLYLDMYIVDYLKYVADLQGIKRKEVMPRIAEMITFCGLEQEKHKKISELSRGYKQRVGFAQALIHNPDILILDEPTSGLDPNQKIEFKNLIKELGKEKTIILSSHILSEIEATCDRILILHKGNIVADGTAESLRKQMQVAEILTIHIEAKEAKEVVAQLSLLPTAMEVQQVPDKIGWYIVTSKAEVSSRKGIFETCLKNDWSLLEMSGSETSLEDIFIELTK